MYHFFNLLLRALVILKCIENSFCLIIVLFLWKTVNFIFTCNIINWNLILGEIFMKIFKIFSIFGHILVFNWKFWIQFWPKIRQGVTLESPKIRQFWPQFFSKIKDCCFLCPEGVRSVKNDLKRKENGQNCYAHVYVHACARI